MLKFNPITPVWFYKKTSTYVPGEGTSETWALVIPDPLYCEWQGTYGDRAISAAAQGIKDSATIRTHYHPSVLNALKTTRIVVVKNSTTGVIVANIPDKTNPNVYELWGGADNVKEENQFMEFRVRRFEGI